MTRDRRGFDYALEPVRSMTEWDMNDVARELGVQNAAADAQQGKVDRLTASFAAARTEVLKQRQSQALLNIDAQRRAHAYMAQVQQHLTEQSAELRSLQQQCDETIVRLNGLRKFADGLDRNKEAAAAEYDQKIEKQGYQLSDDSWLQRLHWRKTS